MDFSAAPVSASAMEFIAEIGLNHNGSIDLAKTMIRAAAEAGATVAKFQTYTAAERVAKEHPLFHVLTECELSKRDCIELSNECAEYGIHFLSTAFGLESLELLGELGQKTVKISSFSLTDRSLIEAALGAGIQLIISTGASTWDEIVACSELVGSYSVDCVFLHCISAYPVALESDLHLGNIPRLKALTGKRVGFSDHSVGPEAFFWSALAGATIFEKHFTTDNQLPGPDQAMSANPEVFEASVDLARRGMVILGEGRVNVFDQEQAVLPFRTRS